MAQILIRNLDKRTGDKLKARAARNGRSLQAERQVILERTAEAVIDPRALAARIRRELSGRRHSDSAPLIAEDRRR